MQLVDYLVATTHPQNPEYTGDAKSYARAVKNTARMNSFISLQARRARVFVRACVCVWGGAGGRAAACMQQLLGICRDRRGATPCSTLRAARPAPRPRQVEQQEPGASEDEAFISFTVTSRPTTPGLQGKPADTQRERSHFVREGGVWLYRDFK